MQPSLQLVSGESGDANDFGVLALIVSILGWLFPRRWRNHGRCHDLLTSGGRVAR